MYYTQNNEEQIVLDYFKNKSGELCVLDIGANKGQSIEFFLKTFKNPIIYAFEPNLELFNKLVTKYKYCSNITLINKGVSDINGSLLFKESILDETSTFQELNMKSSYIKKKSRIYFANVLIFWGK
jgi:FkbM family methyltransferase